MKFITLLMKLILFLIILLIVISFIACNKINLRENNLYILDSSLMAELTQEGNVIVHGERVKELDFSSWTDIKNICINDYAIFGVKSDGSVAAQKLKNGEVLDTSSINDIVMVESLLVNIFFFLNEEGKVDIVSFIGMDTSSFDEVENWEDIVYIEASAFNIVGLDKKGKVHCVSFNDNISDEIKRWRNIEQVTISDFEIVGITANNKIFTANNKDLEPYGGLENAEKICLGDAFVAALFSDGSLKIRRVFEYIDTVNIDDVLALDNLDNVKDIDVNSGVIGILTNDGEIIIAGSND